MTDERCELCDGWVCNRRLHALVRQRDELLALLRRIHVEGWLLGTEAGDDNDGVLAKYANGEILDE